MNIEESLHRQGNDSFREIELHDATDGNHIILSPNQFPGNKQSMHSEIQADPSRTVIIPMNERDIKYHQILHLAKLMKVLCVVEFLMIFTYIIVGFIVLIALLIAPMIGYFSVKKLFSCPAVFYLIYLILSILLRIVLSAALRNLVFIVVASFIIVSNLVAVRYLVRLLKVLKSLSPQERQELQILRNGVPMRNNDTFAMEPKPNVFKKQPEI